MIRYIVRGWRTLARVEVRTNQLCTAVSIAASLRDRGYNVVLEGEEVDD